jgi:hypothetical protein
MAAVNAARPKCKFFARGRCKSGGACKLFHSSAHDSHLLPSVSRYDAQDGHCIEIRPPLQPMFMAHFKEMDVIYIANWCEPEDSEDTDRRV